MLDTDRLSLEVILVGDLLCSRCGQIIDSGSTVGMLERERSSCNPVIADAWWICLACAPIVLLDRPSSASACVHHPEIAAAIRAADPLNQPTEGEG